MKTTRKQRRIKRRRDRFIRMVAKDEKFWNDCHLAYTKIGEAVVGHAKTYLDYINKDLRKSMGSTLSIGGGPTFKI